jgi:L-alanine-DL-glutamate epimerase-like enolase superfamily enzyme
MRIKDIRTRVVRWGGQTVSLPPHFCTNPMDLLELPEASMRTFTFHAWLIVEVFTDDGQVGIGNAALAPQVTRQVIELYLKPLLIGHDPWDIEFLWQHMYRKTMAFGRKGIGMAALSAVDIALWDVLGKSAKQPVYRLLGGRTKQRIPVYASRLYSVALPELGDLLEARAVDYIQFDTNRVGGITQARKIAALAEAYSVPVVPHAGQMHNYHVVMASFNSPMAEYFPVVDVEVGNELFWYIFDGEPKSKDGFINLDENVPGLGLTINEKALESFEVFA